jgi:outer membrane lipoprotein-sorting protein
MIRKSYVWLVAGAFATLTATATATPAVAQTATATAATAPAAASTAAPTADELIEKNIQAKGGREKIKAIKALRMTGSMDIGQGAKAPFTIEMKRPHKMRLEFVVQGMTGIQAYDGSAGWMVMPFMGKKEPEAMSGDDLKGMEEQADFEGPLFDYKAKGNQVEYLGKENVDGTPAYKLKVTKKSGDISYVYLDADAYLEIKEEGKRNFRGQEVEFVSTSGDYKTVEGIVFPFSLGTKPKGAPSGQVITIEKIEVNPSLEDTRFGQPTAVKKEGASKPQ